MLINDEVQRQLLPLLAKSANLPTRETEQRSAAQLQLNPGQQVKAEIIANLSNHLYLARVAGELFKVELPLNVPPGESVPLTFVTAEPRVIFSLRPEGGGETVRLSSLGKWLAAPLPEGGTVQGALLEHPPPEDTSLLAARIRESLTQGGLFYESHLGKWAAGALPLQELFKEPQGKLSRALRRPCGREKPVENGIADDRTLPIVKEQMALLESRVLVWKGEAWPGQGMELAVTEREEGEAEPALEASLSLALPHLGEVRATVRLDGAGVTLEVHGSGECAAVLRAGVDELSGAAAAAGVRLARVVVRHDAEEG